jgi:hypothetical protein
MAGRTSLLAHVVLRTGDCHVAARLGPAAAQLELAAARRRLAMAQRGFAGVHRRGR